MRILVADQNAMLLAAIASTFGRHCVVVTATRRASCLEHLAQGPFDVVVACEKLRDYTGLELLSEIETLAPRTLCIFSATAPRLAQLQSRLDHFRLLGTLSYPIEPRKLLVALKVARTKLPGAARPKVRHVVLESEWDTGERLGILERELEVEPAEPPTLSAAPGSAPSASAHAPARANIPVAHIPTVGTTRKAESPPVQATAAEEDDIPILGIVEETSVSPVRWVHKPSAAEGSFEVSYDEHPNRARAKAVPAPGAPARSSAAPAQVTSAPAQSTAAPMPATSAGSRVSAPPTRVADASSARPTQKASRPPSAQAGTGPSASVNVMAASLGVPANDPSVEPPPPPPPPPVDTCGAANEPLFESDKAGKDSGKTSPGPSGADETPSQKSGAGKSADTSDSKPAAGDAKPKSSPAKTPSGTATKKAAPDGPRQRKQAVPTAAQREAFQRARARRGAGQGGFSIEPDTNSLPSLQVGDTDTTPAGFRPHWHGTHSLTDLARMATNKRPLPQNPTKFAPKRNVVMVGSGVAAVVLASVLAFQLTRSHSPTHHNRQAAAQLFSSNAAVAAQNDASDAGPQVFGPPPGQTQVANAAPTSNLPQPQTFDPNNAPADPPPPPALEHPGPMEPPSMGTSRPPMGMEGDSDAQ